MSEFEKLASEFNATLSMKSSDDLVSMKIASKGNSHGKLSSVSTTKTKDGRTVVTETFRVVVDEHGNEIQSNIM